MAAAFTSVPVIFSVPPHFFYPDGTVPAYSECMRAATGMPSDGSAFAPYSAAFPFQFSAVSPENNSSARRRSPAFPGAAQRRVRSDERQSLLLGRIQCTAVGHQVRDAQRGQAVLPAAEKVARPACFQIEFCDFEAIVRMA